MRSLFKLLILVTQNPLFSLKPLRNIRWWAFKKFFKMPTIIYVSDYVQIAEAHKNSAAKFHAQENVHIGEYTYIDYSGGVFIGNDVAISQGVKIFTHNHSVHGQFKSWNKNPIEFSSLTIGDYAWIGSNVTILEKVTLVAEGSIIAAGSILTKNTEPYSIYAGNPAKKIGVRVVEENN